MSRIAVLGYVISLYPTPRRSLSFGLLAVECVSMLVPGVLHLSMAFEMGIPSRPQQGSVSGELQAVIEDVLSGLGCVSACVDGSSVLTNRL